MKTTPVAGSRLVLAAFWCAVATPALSTTAVPDPLLRLRTQAEAARQRSLPPATSGATDLAWAQLFPPYWKPGRTLDRLAVDKLEDGDPRAAAVMAQIRGEWEDAPVVQFTKDKFVRMVGFPVMPDEGTLPTQQIILVPYYGACVHTPPPPANQMVLVTLDRPLGREMYQYPIWVTGKILSKASTTRHGRVAYLMPAAKWDPYPYQKVPMPQYHFPR